MNQKMTSDVPQIDFARLARVIKDGARARTETVDERWQQILMLAELGHTLEHSAPYPADLRLVRERHEAAWRRANARLFHNAGL